MKPILTLNVGDSVGDYEVIGSVKRRIGAKQYTSKFYILKCTKCGRIKELQSSTIRYEHGITHKSCGKGIKTLDPVFYDRWESMRTRTTNPNYEHADCYSEKGIDSNEFAYFIDFYDKMYESYKALADIIGSENTSLERIDINKGYTSENCTWIDKHDQPKNTSRNVCFEVTYPDGHKEKHKNVREFARDHNLNASTIMDCMNPNRSTKQHKGFRFVRL